MGVVRKRNQRREEIQIVLQGNENSLGERDKLVLGAGNTQGGRGLFSGHARHGKGGGMGWPRRPRKVSSFL